jgi:predicted transposase/invertase (TIGR01784 family)
LALALFLLGAPLNQRWKEAGVRSTLDPTLDVVFKMLFGSPAGHDSLVALLNAVLRPAVPIRRVEVLNPDPGRDQVQDKGIILDLLVILEDGTRIDVEMQAYRDSSLRQRALYYWSKLHVAQLARGQPYAEIRRTISIIFVNANELEGERWHSTFRITEIHDGSAWGDELELHVIELPKRLLEKTPMEQLPPEERDLLAWTHFLGAKNDEGVREACMANANVARAQELLENLSASPSAQELARRREMALFTYNLQLVASRAEGQVEGRAAGMAAGMAAGVASGMAAGVASGMADALSRVLAHRFGPIPASSQQRLRAASTDELARWLDHAFEAASLEALLAL